MMESTLEREVQVLLSAKMMFVSAIKAELWFWTARNVR